MCDEHLSRINGVKHWIDLTSLDTLSIHSEPYRANLRAPEFEPVEIDKMFQKHKFNPASS